MPRPASDDPVVNKPLGLPKSLWPEVEAAAARSKMSRSKWIANLIRSTLGHLPARGSGSADPGCKHPVNRQVGGTCMVCGAKV